MQPETTLTATSDELAAAFSKWLADYQANPEEFTKIDDLPAGDKDYGERATRTLTRVLEEVRAGR